MNKIIATFVGDAPFQFLIEKAVPLEEDGQLIIEGVASTLNVDHDQERMAEPALQQMAHIINEKSVPLRIQHEKGEEGVIGNVFKAWIDDRNKLWIRAALKENNPIAKFLYDGLKQGSKWGLSVGGRVKKAVRELAEGAGKLVKTFYDVMLDEVSVTPRPANYDAWLINKSLAVEGEDFERYYNSSIFNSFLFDNPKLDYLGVIEKSIPQRFWVPKVDKINNDNMKKDTKIDGVVPTETTELKETSVAETSAEETKEETKPVEETAEETKETSVEETATKSYVDSKFNEVLGLLTNIQKAIETSESEPKEMTEEKEETAPVLDQSNPDITTSDSEAKKDLDRPETQEEATGTQETSSVVEVPALDQSEPAVIKFMSGVKNLFKAMTGEEEKTETTETKIDTEKEESKTDTEKEEDKDESSESSSEQKEEYGEDYHLETKKSVPITSIDAFVAYITKAINDMNANLASHGKRVLGIEKMIVDMVRKDDTIQKSIAVWMQEPGQKKSVSLGVPFVTTKEGRRYRLVAESNEIKKSVDPQKGFKEVYKSQFSSGFDN